MVAWAALFVGGLVVCLGSCLKRPPRDLPDPILLITIDGLRADRFEDPVHAPRLSQRAEHSAFFTHVYAPHPATSPSLVSVLTGQAPSSLGVIGGSDPLRAQAVTLAERVAETDVRCEAVMGTDSLSTGILQGFHDTDSTRLGDLPSRVRTRLISLAAQTKDSNSPWFLWVHLEEPAPQGSAEILYNDGLAIVDQALGQVLDTLEELGLHDSTNVVIAGLRGSNLNDLNRTASSLSEGRMRTSVLIDVPRVAAYRVDTPVSLMELAPTLAWLLHVREEPEEFEARTSMTLGVLGRELEPHPVHAMNDDGSRQALWMDGMKLQCGPLGEQPLLYNLNSPKGESQEIAAAYPAEVARMMEALPMREVPSGEPKEEKAEGSGDAPR